MSWVRWGDSTETRCQNCRSGVPAPHGSATTYQRGCRCDECRQDYNVKKNASVAAGTSSWKRPPREIPCQGCGEPFIGKRGTKYCGPKCRPRSSGPSPAQKRAKKILERAARGTSSSKPFIVGDCRMCGVHHARRATGTLAVRPSCMCCSFDCHMAHLEANRKAEKRRQREKWGSNYRSRAKAHGVAHESINKPEVYQRDNWICGICHDPVGKTLAYPDLQSASLDHIIPMSKQGPHLYHNVQCSHLACNIAKSNKLEGEYAQTA